MFENIGSFFRRIVKPEQKELGSKDAAKERLHLVLMQDRANVSSEFLELMKQEILDVIKKYIIVDETQIDVRLTNQQNEDGTNGAPSLYANIPIVNIKNEMLVGKVKEFDSKTNSINFGEYKMVIETVSNADAEAENNVQETEMVEEVIETENIENKEELIEEKSVEVAQEENTDSVENVIELAEVVTDSNEEVAEVAQEVIELEIEDVEVKNDDTVLEENTVFEEDEDYDDDDDVTFDDLLKKAEEEEKLLAEKQINENEEENDLKSEIEEKVEEIKEEVKEAIEDVKEKVSNQKKNYNKSNKTNKPKRKGKK